jgi:hypothetical protein
MNLMVVSEKHGLMIIAVDHELHIYRLDPVTMTLIDAKTCKKVSLENDNVTHLYLTYKARNQ